MRNGGETISESNCVMENKFLNLSDLYTVGNSSIRNIRLNCLLSHPKT